MPTDQLLLIQRTNIVLGVVATAVGGLLWGGRGMLAAGIGAVLAIANFWAIRRLGLRAAAKVAGGEDAPRALPLVAALVGKMALLFAVVWLMIRRVGLPVLPFTLGMSIFVLSILITGLFLGGAGSKLPTSSDHQG
ncbi:MAG: ATP synthase subunit I [Myxococcales bacterium]